MRTTLKDIAKAAGVSHPTVSRVLNGKCENFISEETRNRVFEVAKKLGYRPNMAARSLKTQKSDIIGILGIPSVKEGGLYYYVVDAIVQAVNAKGMETIIGFNYKTEHYDTLPHWNLAGAIVFPGTADYLLEQLDEFKVPFVQFNTTRSPRKSYVVPDDETGMKKALEHLKKNGHKKIIFAGPSQGFHYSVAVRRNSFLKISTFLGIEAKAPEYKYSNPISIVEYAIKKVKATAIITYDHIIALDILKASYENSIKIPEVISLVCFNDVFPIDKVYPPLTAVKVPGTEMGREAIRILFDMIANPDDRIINCILDEDLTIRNSVKNINQ